MTLEHTKASLPALGGGHDRVEVIESGERTLIVVADGAGGASGAARAAELVIEVVREVAKRRTEPIGPAGLASLLARIDQLVLACGHAGQSTAVIVEIAGDRLCGASAGDSGAWLVHGGAHVELTAGQHRKWRLGSGLARPVPFGPLPLCGTLLAATDGLLECAPPDRLAALVGDAPLDHVAGALVDHVRLPNGGLRDDVGLVLCRRSARALAA